MIASRLMSRSPVWLRKIPSTVSGSQGSRRGLRPAVRFAFPLGARLNTTLRARPCQELFSESFSRPSRGPRGAPPSGLRPFAAASSVLYAPPARRGRETRPHTGCRQLQRGGARADGGFGREGGIGPALHPAPHARPTRGPGVSARSRSIDATAPEVRRLRVSALGGGRCSGPHGFRLRGHPEKRRTAASGARPPSARAAPRRPSLVDSLYLYIDMFSSGCRKCA